MLLNGPRFSRRWCCRWGCPGGALGSWGPGVLGCWGPGVLGSWGPGVLGSWGSWGPGVLGCWGPGVLGSWGPGAGVLGSWGPGVLGSWGPGVLGSWPPWARRTVREDHKGKRRNFEGLAVVGADRSWLDRALKPLRIGHRGQSSASKPPAAGGDPGVITGGSQLFSSVDRPPGPIEQIRPKLGVAGSLIPGHIPNVSRTNQPPNADNALRNAP
jgi:hypothetical protein